jgi:hypothetical protein
MLEHLVPRISIHAPAWDATAISGIKHPSKAYIHAEKAISSIKQNAKHHQIAKNKTICTN